LKILSELFLTPLIFGRME